MTNPKRKRNIRNTKNMERRNTKEKKDINTRNRRLKTNRLRYEISLIFSPNSHNFLSEMFQKF